MKTSDYIYVAGNDEVAGRSINLIVIAQMDNDEATQHIRKWEVDNCDQCRATGNVGAIMEEVKSAPTTDSL